jgi:hypothetical protein
MGEYLVSTLRMSLAGVAMLALLGGLGGAVVAQDEAESESATYISGLRTWLESTENGSVHELEMSDPRASGTVTESGISWQEYGDTTPPTVAAVARLELVNEQGTWSGIWSGVYDPKMG